MGKRVIKGIKCILLSICLILTSSLSSLSSIEANADEVTYVDANYSDLASSWEISGGKLAYTTYAGQRHSALSFGYVGITLSRCAPNSPSLANGAATEWIALSMNSGGAFSTSTNNIITKDGYTAVKSYVWADLNTIYNAILAQGYNDWATEFKRFYIDGIDTDNVCYLRLDFILVTRYNFADQNIKPKESGQYIASTKTALGEVYLNTPNVDGLNPNQIRNNAVNPYTGARPISWSLTTRNDFDKFYNIYLPTGSAAVTGNIGGASSLYETKNVGVGFDISQAIPAGEQVRNTVSASCANGTVDVRNKTATYTYTATYKYNYQTKNYDFKYVGHTTTGNGDYNSSGTYVGDGNGEYKRGSAYTVYVGPKKGNYSQSGNWMGVGRGAYNLDYHYTYVGSTTTYHGNYDSARNYHPGAGDYDYVFNGTYTSHTLSNYTFTYVISVTYQYVNGINIQVIDNMTVYNNAFPGGKINYSQIDFSNTNVIAKFILRSQSAKNGGLSYDTITNGNNISGYDFTPNGDHYGFPTSPSTATDVNLGVKANQSEAENARTSDINSRYDTIANSIGTQAWSRNDLFSLSDNGTTTTFMDDSLCNGSTITYTKPGSSSAITKSYGTQAASSSHKYATTYESWINGLNANRSTSSKTVTIPTSVGNGDFPTAVTATYKSIIGSASTTYGAGKNFGYSDSIYNHVIPGGVLAYHNGGDPDDGYPIRVHVPVVAPFSVVYSDETDAIEDTQLVSAQVNGSADYELLLDKTYYLKFDNDQWYSQIYGIPPGYANVMDRYVSKKQVRFPFSVIYNGVYYPKTSSGYTKWITVQKPGDISTPYDYGVDTSQYESANHWQMMPFTIPSMADDCGMAGSDAYIEVAVTAINFTGTPLADDDATAVNIIRENTLTSQYVASSRRQVQLSGWIYDFSVVGTDNQAMYTGNSLTSSSVYEKMGDISFANLKAELKSGSTNRLGTANLRYLKDGSLITSLNTLQTLPMRTGQSFVFNNMGNVWKGQTFGFSIKTMADLNGENDYIRITPHFHYINAAGEVLDSSTGDFKMYLAEENNGKLGITEYEPGNTDLTGAETAYLGMQMFDESYYDSADSNGRQQLGNWVQASVTNENNNNAAAGYLSTVTTREYMNRKTSSFTVNTIYIPSTLRFMSGEYEQLEMNDGKAYDRATGMTTLTTYWDIISNYSTAYEETFKDSMQQWMSCYMIPSNTYVIDTRALGGSAFDIYNYIDSQSDFDFDSSPIVEHDTGTLVIGFDIVAYRNGVPYLTYAGGNNMWLTESPTPSTTPDPEDKVIVDMSKTITSYFEPAIQNIN